MMSAMFWRTVSLLGLGAMVLSVPVPQQYDNQGGFQPLHGARGPSGPNSGYNQPPPPANSYPPPPSNDYSGGPTKTIYVNVPQAKQEPAPAPIAAGPPRKHYKIVFIRAPTPPPAPQPILPPRTEQKTLIYVLHQRQQAPSQEVIEVPTIKHNPEVYFVQYDNPPTAEELQQLTAGAGGGYPLGSGGLPGGISLSGGLPGGVSFADGLGGVSLPGGVSLSGGGVPIPSDSFRELAPGSGSPNLIQADADLLGNLGFDSAPAASSADAGVPIPSAIADSGVPLPGESFAAPPATAPAVDPVADTGFVFDSFADPIQSSAPASPITDDRGGAGVPLPSSPISGGGVAIPSLGSSPGGSTIAAGVGGPVGPPGNFLQVEDPQTFSFGLEDAFGQRTSIARR